MVIPRFEFVIFTLQRFLVADSIMARAGFEDIAEGERAERCIATRAAAGNGQPVPIHKAAFHQVARAVYAVIHIDDAPLSLESLAISAAIACTAPIIHIKDGYTPAGPILDLQVEFAIGHPCWPAMAHNQ